MAPLRLAPEFPSLPPILYINYRNPILSYSKAPWGLSVLSRVTGILTFQHRAGVSSYTSSFDLAETCVFAKQSPGPILCGHIAVAPLFPKLRGQFAEFLNYPSPVGLRILFLSTCVGLRYGHLRYTQGFSRLSPRMLPYLNFSPLRPGQPSPGSCAFQVSPCLNLLTVTEYQPFVHRLRLSASP